MKFGYFCNPSDPGLKRDWLEVMNEARDLAEFCDKTGFDSFWLAEHHFSHSGRYILPNPIAMGIDIAARTKNIRVGVGAAIITFWHPLRLAEDIAMLDQLSGGRLELGVGRGNYGIEGVNLNAIADPRNPEANMQVFSETVQILQNAFSQRRFSYAGKNYHFPAPGFASDRRTVTDADYIDAKTGELIKLTVVPRTRQQPYPPMWQVVDSPSSIEFAAKHDLGIIMWRPPAETLRERFQLHHETAAKSGRQMPFGSRTGIMRDTFVAETAAEARALAERYIMPFLNFSNWRGPHIYLRPEEKLSEETEQRLKKELDFDFVNKRSLLFGSPEEVVERIEELQEVANVEQVLLNTSWSGMPHELTMRSMRLFADRVMPKIKRREAARQPSPAQQPA